ncbi:hypothetical protein SPHINGO8AM_100044 [Sphingomonas sp. 8AM]|nr:hypothetical protein SPHINGO8AM_100044 [Sphingomonas sp. 8AM]
MILPFIPENTFYLIRLFYLMSSAAILSSATRSEQLDLSRFWTLSSMVYGVRRCRDLIRSGVARP